MRYLIHSTIDFSKDKEYTLEELKNMKDNSFCNMFHIYSLCNSILKEEDTATFYNFNSIIEKSEKTINFINDNFDCVVLFLGGVYIKKFNLLKNITIFLQNLKIKLLIPGVGCVLPNNMTIEKFKNDSFLKNTFFNFINESLHHTKIIGVTDYLTGKILNDLGFIENVHYYVCGLHSIFYNGVYNYLPDEFPKVNKNTKICIFRNLNIVKNNNDKCVNFFSNIYRTYKNCFTINTFLYDFFAVNESDNKYIYNSIFNYKKLNNMKYKVFNNLDCWLEELSWYNLCISERLNDCLAAIALGVPSILLCTNKYEESVAEYYKIPYIHRREIFDDTTIDLLLKHVKYKLVDTLKNYNYNFERYVNFFKLNDIIINKQEKSRETPFKKELCKNIKRKLNIKLDVPEKYFLDKFDYGHYVSSVRKQAWAIELDLLKIFQDICEKNDIKYYVDAGTLLGAVRHQGFIPWDDDIDIIMYPNDYDKFVEIAKKEVPELFQDYYETPIIWMTRLRNPNTTFISEAGFIDNYNFNQGLFIDIFRMDNVPEDDCEYRDFARKLKLIKEAANAKYKLWWKYERDNNELKKDADILRKKFEIVSRQYNDKETNVNAVLTNCSGNSFRGQEIRKWKSDFADIVLLDFEMLKVPCPIGYDNVLKNLYQNYSIIKKDGSLHGKMYIDPYRTYKDYIKNK